MSEANSQAASNSDRGLLGKRDALEALIRGNAVGRDKVSLSASESDVQQSLDRLNVGQMSERDRILIVHDQKKTLLLRGALDDAGQLRLTECLVAPGRGEAPLLTAVHSQRFAPLPSPVVISSATVVQEAPSDQLARPIQLSVQELNELGMDTRDHPAMRKSLAEFQRENPPAKPTLAPLPAAPNGRPGRGR